MPLASLRFFRYNTKRMSTSPRLSEKSQTTSRTPRSAAMILVVTALDTTWRAFVPTIGGTLIGVALDKVFSIAPIATTICIILGFATSTLLIIHQLKTVRKSA